MDYKPVKYSNQLNDLNLDNLSLIDRRFFFAFLYACRNHQVGEEIVLTRKELMELGIFPPGKRLSTEQYVKAVKQVIACCQKSFSFYTKTRDPKNPNILRFEFFEMFTGFKLEVDEKTPANTVLRFKIDEDAGPYLFNLMERYTLFHLGDYLSLRSTYSQSLFIHLKQFRRTGRFIASVEHMRRILNIPPHYKQSNIDQRVLKPATKELKTFFPGLKCTKLKNGEDKRRVTHYLFEWEIIAELPAPNSEKSTEQERENSNSRDTTLSTHFIPKNGTLPSLNEIKTFLTNSECHLTLHDVLEILSKRLEIENIFDWQAYILGAARNKDSFRKSRAYQVEEEDPLTSTTTPEFILKAKLMLLEMSKRNPLNNLEELIEQSGMEKEEVLYYINNQDELDAYLKHLGLL